MTTPRLILFPATIPRAETCTTITRSCTALYGYLLDFGDDSSDEDLSETAKSLHTQTASTSVGHPPPNRPLPTSHAFTRRPGKEISMPLGYRAAMYR
ncbi:hypothetical protein Tco_0951922 [Tanacetum coccineum]|uniref:Uncharacterized protein n=1 Tax=Tanacetum coccineum TaxID=301880 RepID=A0ABQ5DWA8_9ASTR